MQNLVRTSGKGILVPPGIRLRPTIVAAIPTPLGGLGPEDDEGLARANFRLEYSEAKGRYEIAAFGIDRRSTPIEITGAFWRTVRVHSIVRPAIELALPSWTWPISALRTPRVSDEPIGAPRFEAQPEDGLLLAATAYRIAEISNENPALAVAETLGLKQRTATNWVQRARAAGYMTASAHESAARRIAAEIERTNPITLPSEEELARRIVWSAEQLEFERTAVFYGDD
ncbi:hypothetical protein [Microbacterium sp. SD291]|uniref:hypothetical protein n=1 Tax=Microbacterium sp. SD291 TaxID=2782007 RepID=UPI001A95DAAD|nr:hypothetical protein [Microbacterium sp. SD291]MBO0981615.1 hypothetical protein [Microbacterium sp. SD291]